MQERWLGWQSFGGWPRRKFWGGSNAKLRLANDRQIEQEMAVGNVGPGVDMAAVDGPGDEAKSKRMRE